MNGEPMIWLMGLVRLFVFVGGALLALKVIVSAVRTFVLPRPAPDWLIRFIFRFSRRLFAIPLRRATTFAQKDNILAHYAPFTLVAIPPVWLFLVDLGFTCMFWAVDPEKGWLDAFWLSGSSILTLGFVPAETIPARLLVFTEATIGLVLVALLISYIPTIYGAFSARERAVTLLDVRAGNPPSVFNMMARMHRIGREKNMTDFWQLWEEWFAQIEESHTSLPMLIFYRSPQPEYSWLTAAGAVLDSATFYLSTLDVPADPQAALCIRAGYLALRRIADYFEIEYPRTPTNLDPIAVSRAEYDALCEDLEAAGVKLKADREQAWLDFKGWRVNYERPLLGLCAIVQPPIAPWSSDRPVSVPPLPLFPFLSKTGKTSL